jgi:hypothetical protein
MPPVALSLAASVPVIIVSIRETLVAAREAAATQRIRSGEIAEN